MRLQSLLYSVSRIFGVGAFIFGVTTFVLFSAAYAIWNPCVLSPSGCDFLDCNIDTDGDGIPNVEELALGLDGYETSPNDPDTDMDGLWDGLDHCPLDAATEEAALKETPIAAAPAESPKPEASASAKPEAAGDGGPVLDDAALEGAEVVEAGETAGGDDDDWGEWGDEDEGEGGEPDGGGDDWGAWDQFEETEGESIEEAAPVAVVDFGDRNERPNSCPSGTVKDIWDTDQDGVPDREEKVAGEDGFVTDPNNPDSDNDQVNDREDRCPAPKSDGSADQPVDTDGDGDLDACESGAPLKQLWWERTSLPGKYACWITNLATGRAGTAEKYQGVPLTDLVLHSFYETFILILFSLLLAALASLPVVALTYRFRRKRLLVGGVDFFFAFLSVPIVLVGYVLGAMVNSVDFNVFATFDQSVRLVCTDTEWIRYDMVFTSFQCGSNYFTHLFLPAIVLALGDGNLGHFVRDMSNNLNEVSTKAFMRYARARGVSPVRLAFRYLLKNVTVPALTFLQYRIVFLLSGVLVVEVMFDRKGLGRLMINAINEDYDIPTFLASLLAFLVLVFIVQTVTRILQVAIDRRLAG